jgi:hypothetical protein
VKAGRPCDASITSPRWNASFRKNFEHAIELFELCLALFEQEFCPAKETWREMESLGNAHRAKGNTDEAYRLISKRTANAPSGTSRPT